MRIGDTINDDFVLGHGKDFLDLTIYLFFQFINWFLTGQKDVSDHAEGEVWIFFGYLSNPGPTFNLLG